MNQPEITAVLVAWRSGDMLERCVSSLRTAAQHAKTGLQLAIVDNSSHDGSVERVHLEAGDVLIANPVNAGYGVAAAQGLSRASARWALLINPDTTVAVDFLEHLMRAAREAPADVATLVPEMRYAASPAQVNCRGVTVDEIGIPSEIDVGVSAGTSPGTAEPLGGSSGCCLLRLSALRAVGGLEVAYFAYLEDVDLALRLARAGYRAVLVRDAVVWHEGSASTGSDSAFKAFLVARNRRLLFRLEGVGGVTARLRRGIVDLGHGLISSSIGSSLTAPWSGRRDALRLRPYLRFTRRARVSLDRREVEPTLTSVASLRSSLRRKRAATKATRQAARKWHDPV